MVKKFLLSAAVIGALSTSAMAYNVNELANMVSQVGNSATAVSVRSNTSNITARGFDQTRAANTLIFPEFNVDSQWETTVRVFNPHDYAVVAKVVLYDGKDSHEVKDFNIYLSAHDVWVGKIRINENSIPEIISTDDSTPLENGGQATKENPFKAELVKNGVVTTKGYIEVIEMASLKNNNGTDYQAHQLHALLRKAYKEFSFKQRTGSTNPDLTFKDGVIQNGKATFPYITLIDNNNNPLNVNTYYEVNLTDDSNVNHIFDFVGPQSDLRGDIRITDVVNGKDMDMMAYKVDYNTNNSTRALIYLEGEKANVADVEINPNTSVYEYTNLQNDINAISSNTVYLTYGDADIKDMYAVLTNPFKRVYVQACLDASDGNLNGTIDTTNLLKNTVGDYYKDAFVKQGGTIDDIDYGSASLIAKIYDESENRMSDGQFSPATTPTITLKYELDFTSNTDNWDDKTKLPYYLTQAANNGFTRGYIELTNENSNVKIPGIMTQMLATQAGDRVVTNWIVPEQQ